MATETPVDPVEEARRRVNEARDQLGMYIEYPIRDSDSARKSAAGWLAEFEKAVTAAILASDPRVQALEAVARAAARMAGEFEFEFRTDPSRMAVVEALAALQEETGEDG